MNIFSENPKLRYLAIIVFKRTLFVLTLWFVGLSLYRAILQVDWSLLNFRLSYIAYGFILLCAGTFMASEMIRLIYLRLGFNLSMSQTFSLLTIPSLGKYLPGKVFSVMGHIALAQSYGIGVPMCSTAIGLSTTIGLAAPILLGVPVLLLGNNIAFKGIFLDLGTCTLLLILPLLALDPRVYRLIITLGLKLFKRPSIEFNLGFTALAAIMTLTMVQTILYLGGFAVTVLGILQFSVSALPNVVGAMCLANVAGFLALFAPGGIGVREGILLVILTPVVGPGNAGMITVLMRIIQTLVDILSAGAGYLALRMIQRSSDSPSSGI